MKIGTSLGKCVKSILAGDVAYDEVLYVVSNTHGPDENGLREIMSEYYYGARRGAEYDMSAFTEEEVQDLALRLFNEGKLFQPRIHLKSGGAWGNAHSLRDTWYDILPSQSSSAAAKEAWDHYVFLSKMTS